MENMSSVSYFTLEGHVALEDYRYLYFTFALIAYLLIICFNTVVIFIICRNKHLHEPMYIFIAALLCNSLFGTTALYPKLLADLLSETQVTSYAGCLLQAFCMYTYTSTEFVLLSVMAYDRYVSICKPLHYATLVRMNIVRRLLFLSWCFPCFTIGIVVLLTSRLQLCRSKLNRVFCDNYSIVKLSCKEAPLNNIFGLFIFTISLFPPVFFIIYSYVRILTVCLKNSKDFRRKALQTCLPHLLIFIMLSVNMSFEIINSRIESKQIPHVVSMFLSVEYLLVPPLFNPIIYGLKLHEILSSIRKLISCKMRARVHF